MKGFKLYMVDLNGNDILLSDYEIGRPTNQMLTYDENLSEQEHDRYDFSFSVVDTDNFGVNFNLIDNLKIGRELKLYRDDDTKYILLVVTGINPDLQKENNTYSITSQDYASYVWSKNNTSVNFDSFTNEEFLEFDLFTDGLNIGNYILSRGQISEPLFDSGVPATDNIVRTIRGQDVRLTTLGTKLYTAERQHDDDWTYTFNGQSQVIIPDNTVPFTMTDGTHSVVVDIKDNYITLKEENQYDLTYLDSIHFYFLSYFYEIDFQDVDSWSLVIDSTNQEMLLSKVNLAVTDSNTYNSLIELANLLNALMFINYENKTITYLDRESTELNKSYTLSPSFNLSELNLTIASENFAPLMFVTGGKDEYDLDVTMVPEIPPSALTFLIAGESTITDFKNKSFYHDLYYSTNWEAKAIAAGEEDETLAFIEIADKIPYLDSFLINLDYFESADLLSNTDKEDNILSIIYNDLRTINYRFQSAIKNKLTLNSAIYSQEQKILSLSELIVSEDVEGFSENLNNLEVQFYDILGDINSPEVVEQKTEAQIIADPDYTPTFSPAGPDYVQLVRVSGAATTPILLDNTGSSNDGNLKISAEFSVPNINLWGEVFSLYQKLPVPNYNWVWEIRSRTTPDISVSTYVDLINNYPASSNQGSIAYVFGGDTYQSNYVITSTTDEWLLEGSTYGFDTYINFITTVPPVIEYSWFSKMLQYGGDALIEEKYTYYLDLIKEYIDERADLVISIKSLGLEIGGVAGDERANLEVELAGLNSRKDDIYLLIGDCTYLVDVLTYEDMGKYLYIYEAFNKYKIQWDADIPAHADPTTTTLQQYKNVYNEKQAKWFNLKKTYGKFLIEGYYSNDLETSPIQLYNQAVLYSYNYNIPKQSYGVTMISIDDLIGVDINRINVGDIVKIIMPDNYTLSDQINYLQITAIDSELRSSSNISLQVYEFNETQKLLEKLLLGLN